MSSLTTDSLLKQASPPPLSKLLRNVGGEWQQQLEYVYEMIREMSRQTDPQEMVRQYSQRMQEINPVDRRISLSRRGLKQPWFRVTRFSEWQEDINPWQQSEHLPLRQGGLFAELLYGNYPRLIDDLDEIEVALDDPARQFIEGQRSLMAIPLFDQGEGINMVIVTRQEPGVFNHENFPGTFWLANLFGQATQNLVLNDRLREAYRRIDRELQVVADIQRALLPKEMPDIAGLDMAAYYRTSHRAGGDYYDFFPLADGKWGLLIADVSGHGTPSAVVMAIMHSIAHLYPTETSTPDQLLTFVNEHLANRYTSEIGTFVTAFYGIYDPRDRTLVYSSAGHNPPRITRACSSSVNVLDEGRSLPLGLMAGVPYTSACTRLDAGDRLILYTDGITEAQNSNGDLFGVPRLDSILQSCAHDTAESLVDVVVRMVDAFTGGIAPSDDRTMVIATVKETS